MAPRLLFRMWGRSTRGALPTLCLLLSFLSSDGAAETKGEIVEARYANPTTRYPHGVLGDEIEHTQLVLSLKPGPEIRFELPDELVFEDVAPRLADLDADGLPEVIVVESHQAQGARLAIYGADGRITATPFIGQRFRWLAPIGATDLDGDGRIEIAYIDRPHLAKHLRVWRYQDNGLVPVADLGGLSNHRIGEPDIAGGLRDCGDGPEMITADAAWQNLVATRFVEGRLVSRPIGPHRNRQSFAEALKC